MYTGRQLQARLSFALKSIFWLSTALLGFMLTWLAPALSDTLRTLLIGAIGFSAVASIVLDIVRRGNVLLWTAVMLIGGVAILWAVFSLHESFITAPARPLFNLARPTPTP